jgi:hypothetical protein
MIRSIQDLVKFLNRFHRDWLDDPSLAPSLVPPDLPDGLATIYRELGALVEIEQDSHGRAPFASQDCLMPLSRLKRVDGMLVFSWENQGNWSCRCQPGEPDPPVYSNAADVWNEEQRGFVVVCNSLNHFLITLCLQEALYSCRNLVAIEGHPRPEEAIIERLEPLWLCGRLVNAEPSHDFFVTSDNEAIVMNYAGVWIGSRSRPVQQLVASGLKSMVLAGAEGGPPHLCSELKPCALRSKPLGRSRTPVKSRESLNTFACGRGPAITSASATELRPR